MKQLLVRSNDNTEYPDKEEFIRLAAVTWPTKKKFRWDKAPRTLANFLWFLRFEASFTEESAKLRREEFEVIK